MKFYLNGKELESLELVISLKVNEEGYCGTIKATLLDGSQFEAKILKDMLPYLLSSQQRLFLTDKGKISLEWLEK